MHGSLTNVEQAINGCALEPEIRTSSPLGRGWYAVYTAIKSEFNVKDRLEAKGFGAFLPCETKIRVRRGKRQKFKRPVFSRYVFVSFDPDLEDWWPEIKYIDDVEAILSNNRSPVRIPAKEIRAIQLAEANGAFDKDKLPAPGEQFMVVTGPFADFIGKVVSARANGRVKLLLKRLMGGAIPAEFSLAELERIR